ncbi:MAG TPA: STAS/SEC14 domain-containing protein [Leptospiraceae bacterium]|nr:STAS/SEC14 domain-containing protein [Leptospiraceae bacterium]HMW06086.1 STAS/SEC14 domain-containing protein [Leptospiraceae bacterium]HMX33374.1 STAS/SEC14 domain-containing protein [Leptospiraceae bacterium]HMY31372.1 STAS/SEC14 domain-containing protein [Leptospiraceae bacterium]HMZ65008.1 STAS/SEC14 domain-containing protein [Leptospiraceae bacterium]
MEEIKFENSMAQVKYNKDLKIVEVHWKKSTVDEFKFQEVLNNGLKELLENTTNKWLANTSLLGVIPQRTAEWVEKEWFPNVLKTVKKIKMAIIVPESMITKMSIDKTIKTDVLEQQYFENLDEARNWLKG